LIDPQVLILNTAKGLYLKEKKLLSEAVFEALGRQQPYALLSGPSFAKEMMRDMPTAVVVASR
jgi:glycerol-3-phosphate dehydrogenase